MSLDTESVVIDIFGHDDAPFTKYPLPSMSPAETAFYLVYVLDAEVKNGGIQQYFVNATLGTYQPENLVAALETVGATEAVLLVRQTSEILFGSFTIPADSKVFEAAVDDLTDEQIACFEPIDDAFYKIDIPGYLLAYANQNQATIRGASKVKGLFGH